MPSLIAGPKIHTIPRSEPGSNRSGWTEEETSRSSRVSTQLRPNGEGGYLKTVRKIKTFSCTTHQKHVTKSSNSYETSKVIDQSKSEGLIIEVNSLPQHRRERFGRDYAYDGRHRVTETSNLKVLEDTPRSFLRIGQHQYRNEENIGSFAQTIDPRTQSNGLRSVIPTTTVVAEGAKAKSKAELMDNTKANEVLYQQFTTNRENRRLRRKILRSHDYHRTITKISDESSQDIESSETSKQGTTSDRELLNESATSIYVDSFCAFNGEHTNGKEEANSHNTGKAYPPENWSKSPANHNSVIIVNESAILDSKQTASSYHKNYERDSAISLRSFSTSTPQANLFKRSENSSFSESNGTRSSSGLFLQHRVTNIDRNSLSTHDADNHCSTSPDTEPLVVTNAAKSSKKTSLESKHKLTAKSHFVAPRKTVNPPASSAQSEEINKIHIPVVNGEIKQLSSPRLHKISKESVQRNENCMELASSGNSAHQLNKQTRHITGRQKLLQNNNQVLKENVPLSPNSSGSREESLTDEDRSMNEFIAKQSTQKECFSKYYFGVPTAKIRTKFKNGTDSATKSSSSLDSTENMLPEKLIFHHNRDYQESWSGSESETTQWSSEKEKSDHSSSFKEDRTRRGPIEVRFSVKTRSQTRISENPYIKDVIKRKSGMMTEKDETSSKQSTRETKHSDKIISPWKILAEEKENEITYSQETKRSIGPTELRLSVISFEHKRVLKEKTENEQTEWAKKRANILSEKKENSMKEKKTEEQQPEIEQKQDNTIKELNEEYPMKVNFTVKSSVGEINRKSIKSDSPLPSHINANFSDGVRKEDKKEEINRSKLKDQRETEQINKKCFKGVNISKQESRNISSAEQPLPNSKRAISAIIIEKPVNQRIDNGNAQESSFKVSGTTANKIYDKCTSKVSMPTLASSSRFNRVKAKMSGRTKDLSLTETIIQRTDNEPLDVVNENVLSNTSELSIMKYTSLFQPSKIASSSMQVDSLRENRTEQLLTTFQQNENFIVGKADEKNGKHSSFRLLEHQSSDTFQETVNTETDSPSTTRGEDYVNNSASERSDKLSQNFRSRVLKANTSEQSTSTYHQREHFTKVVEKKKNLPNVIANTVLSTNNTWLTQKPIYMCQLQTTSGDKPPKFKQSRTFTINNNLVQVKEGDDSKLSQNVSKTTDIVHSLKSPISLNQQRRIVKSISNSQPEAQQRKSDDQIGCDTERMQCHLASMMDTKSVLFHHREKHSEENVHRCECKLKLNGRNVTAVSKMKPSVDQTTVVCYIQSLSPHRGFKLKSWKEEVIINRMLLHVQKGTSTRDWINKYKSSHFLITAPTDWAQSTVNVHLLSEDNIVESNSLRQKNFLSVANMKTSDSASQRIKENAELAKINKGIETKKGSARLVSGSEERDQPNNENHLELRSMRKEELTNERRETNVYYIYETSL